MGREREKRFHYTYRIKFPSQGWFYFGIHSTDNLDDGYSGSPSTHREKWNLFHWEMEILEFFETRHEGSLVEKRLIDHFLNDPMCLNEHSTLCFSIETCREGGRKGGRSVVESGVLEETRRGCNTPEQRRKVGEFIRKYNSQRDPEWWREQCVKGGLSRGEKISRPCILVHTITGETHEFPNVKSAEILGLHSSNLYNILNGKRSNPHKGWNIYLRET